MSNPSSRPGSAPGTLRRVSGRGWPPQAVLLLERLWREGDLSAREIAERLGVTRNAVLGKVHRLGLCGQQAPKPPAARPRRQAEASEATPAESPPGRRRRPRPDRLQTPPPRASPSAASAVAAAFAAELEAVASGLVAHLEALAPDACHWPCGDPKDAAFAFCGRPAATPPYCATHARIAYRPGAGAPLSQLLKLARGRA